MKKHEILLKECENVIQDLHVDSCRYRKRAESSKDPRYIDYCMGRMDGLESACGLLRFYLLGGGRHHES